jgi:hypothetical protein
MKRHELLANARNNTVWKKVMAETKKKGQSIGVTVLNDLLNRPRIIVLLALLFFQSS